MHANDNTAGEQEIARFQSYVLNRVLVLVLLACVTSVITTFRDDYMRSAHIFDYAILPGAIVVACATFWPKAPIRFRQLALILGLLTAAVGAVARAAFLVPNGFCAHLLLVVLVGMFMGRRAAWLVWALGMLLWMAIAARFIAGAKPPSGQTFDPSMTANWVRVLTIYGALSATGVAAVTYLMNKMVGTIRRSESLHAALTQESGERIAALEQRRMLEERLVQAQKLESLGTLAGGIAHDFNNLLVVIINNAEMAEDEDLPPMVREALVEIRQASNRAAALTQQLLTFARRQDIERSAIEIDTAVSDTLHMLRRLLPETISVTSQQGCDGALIWASAIEVNQVLINLCINARDAMPNGGTITITSEVVHSSPPQGGDERNYVCLKVADTGSGMDEQTCGRAFEPFFTTKPAGSGTGLGLSTVHGIVQQLGGTIELNSIPDKGTTITVCIPEHKSSASAKARATPELALRGDETMLVVDDDHTVRASTSLLLQRYGYQVLDCSTGQEALQIYRDNASKIALIISDAIMPNMGGRDLYQKLTEQYGEIPFLVCSGYTDQTFDTDFFSHPTRAFIAKPFDAKTLAHQIRILLDHHKTSESTSANVQAEMALRAKPCS